MLTGRGAISQTAHNNSAVVAEDSPRYFNSLIPEVSTRLYVSPGLHLCAHSSEVQKKLLLKARFWEEVIVSLSSAFVGRGHG